MLDAGRRSSARPPARPFTNIVAVECMQKGCALGVALMIVCSSVGGATAEETKPTNAIRVVEATYGGNCMGVAKGNVTKFVASTCDGTDLCNYRVYYKNMGAVTLRQAAKRPSASTTSAGKIGNPRPVT